MQVQSQLPTEWQISEESVGEYLLQHPDYYVIAVEGAVRPWFSQVTEEALRSSSYLEPQSSLQRITAATVRYVHQTWQPKVEFLFPRQRDSRPVIEPAEKKIKFYCQAGKTKISVTFDLRKMVRDGQPDL
jgi:hypothetical protein